MSVSNDSDKEILDDFLGKDFKNVNQNLTSQGIVKYKTYGAEGSRSGISLSLRTPLITALEESIHPRVPKDRKEQLINTIIPALIRAGADVNQASNGLTPLALAIVLGEFFIVKQIVGAGADLRKPIERRELEMWGYLKQIPPVAPLRSPRDIISAVELVDLARNDSPQRTGILKLLGVIKKGVRWADEESNALAAFKEFGKEDLVESPREIKQKTEDQIKDALKGVAKAQNVQSAQSAERKINKDSDSDSDSDKDIDLIDMYNQLSRQLGHDRAKQRPREERKFPGEVRAQRSAQEASIQSAQPENKVAKERTQQENKTLNESVRHQAASKQAAERTELKPNKPKMKSRTELLAEPKHQAETIHGQRAKRGRINKVLKDSMSLDSKPIIPSFKSSSKTSPLASRRTSPTRSPKTGSPTGSPKTGSPKSSPKTSPKSSPQTSPNTSPKTRTRTLPTKPTKPKKPI